MEIYKDIKGLEGFYQVSNLGNVKSFMRNNAIVMKNGTDTCGYKYVCLKGKNYSLHRLVALMFINNLENKTEVNHINGVKSDNSVENLEWCTKSENQLHAYKIGLQKGKPHGDNPRAKKVINIKTNDVLDSASLAHEFTLYKYSTFIAMLQGRFKNKSDFRYL